MTVNAFGRKKEKEIKIMASRPLLFRDAPEIKLGG